MKVKIILVSAGSTLQVPGDWTNCPWGSAPKVATPTITPNGGSFTDSVRVTLACATTGSQIYYTIDNSSPTNTKTLYSAPFKLTATTTIKARGILTNYTDSDTVKAAFVKGSTGAVIMPLYGAPDENRVTLRLSNSAISAAAPVFLLDPQAKSFNLRVFDMNGRTLYRSGNYGLVATGNNYIVSWDGRTQNKTCVDRGVYFVRCRFGNTTETRALVIRK